MTPRHIDFLLTERTNPHSPIRANGIRFWGHPHRVGGLDAITCIGIHTTENNPSPATALNVAWWQAFDAQQPSSYHRLVDSDHIVRTLPDVAVAFHIVGLNTRALGLSFGTRHDWWGKFPAWDAGALDNAAQVAADWCRRYRIPVRWITLAEANRGVRGFIRHSVADPSRRRDPGTGFPAAEFFRLVNRHLSPAVPSPQEDIVASIDDLKNAIRDEVPALVRREVDGLATRSGQTLNHQRTNEATRLAEAATMFAVRQIRAEIGMTPDPASDVVQVRYLRHGRAGEPYTLADAERRLREAAARGEDSFPATDPAHGYEVADASEAEVG